MCADWSTESVFCTARWGPERRPCRVGNSGTVRCHAGGALTVEVNEYIAVLVGQLDEPVATADEA